ncbi:MAG: FeoB-associated Cys-rich membrane protein [Eubacteriales bacterium]|nr:FeoB-associated Cys-rich membrane protein [Eubacteriales bacterium]
MGDIVVIICVGALVALAIGLAVSHRRRGGCCSGGCAGCTQNCPGCSNKGQKK